MKASPPSESRPGSSMGGRERFVWQAVVAALMVHVFALAALAEWGGVPASQGTAYAEVDFADFALPEQTQTMEEAVREKMQAKMNAAVRNVAADAQASRSTELRSSAAATAQMARDVEAELRAFEQSAFDALSEGRVDPKTDPDRGEPDPSGAVDNRYEGWDARYDGQVTAEYSLSGRKALGLDVPGYRCRGGGVVMVRIEVAPGGEVLDAQLLSVTGAGTQAMSECLSQESLRSALRCRFQSQAEAPKRQEGTLTYRFIAQ
ncbi:hypothetical protein N9C70_03180 [Flavobacteriales bacterium]|nr:hypothetical protein [Flavobacteriales bacterium]